MSATEAYIKLQLDGTFTRIDNTGKSITVDVPHDFIPKHHQIAGRQLGDTGPHVPYTPADDTIILELRRRRMAVWDIAARLLRTEDSVRHRIRHLEGKK